MRAAAAAVGLLAVVGLLAGCGSVVDGHGSTAATGSPRSRSTSTPTGPKRFVSTAAQAALAAATTVPEAQTALSRFLSQYGVSAAITTVTPSSYAAAYDTFKVVTQAELADLLAYGRLFIDEWAKYPTDWIAPTGLRTIAFVTNFATQGTARAAGPDPIGSRMYYDVTYVDQPEYCREVIHHEFDHFIEYRRYHSYDPPDPAWTADNPPGFHYGSGGASCYPYGACDTSDHPRKGFVSGYAESAIEEDKAETYGYLMTAVDYRHVEVWIRTDPYLAEKVKAMEAFVVSVSPEMNAAYFAAVNR